MKAKITASYYFISVFVQRVISDPRGGARRAGAAGRADGVRGSSEEAGRREERLPLPALCHLHQTEEPQPGTHHLQLQTQHQGMKPQE